MYEVGDMIELIVNVPSTRLYAGQQGTIVHRHSPDDFEIEFSDDTGSTIDTMALSSKQFIVIWESRDHQWVSVPMQTRDLMSKLPNEVATEVLDFARFLALRNNQKIQGQAESELHQGSH
ncbi:MAG: DUF4926 domain-containing protein [SAR324 cluster bacterium]|nr:DUF4926 domain-containing protein [SAR324 cluster bacterium]